MSAEFNLTIEDVAKIFGVNKETVRRWCRDSKIRYVKLPGEKGEYRFSNKDISDFVTENSKGGRQGINLSYNKPTE